MSGQGVRWLISLTWLISPRGRGRPKAEEAVDATIPVADNVASNLTDCEINALRTALLALPCVVALTELQQDLLIDGAAQALPLYIATRGANRNDSSRKKTRGMKTRFHRAHLLNDLSKIWEAVTGQSGTLWVKRRMGKPPLVSPVVQVAKAAAQVIGDDLSLSGWRSQIPLAEDIIRKDCPLNLSPQSVITLKG